MKLELITNQEIINLNFTNRILSLPEANIRLANTSFDLPLLFYTLYLQIKNKINNNTILNFSLLFEIISREWDGLLNLTLTYGNIFNFTFTPPANSKTTTLCNQSLTSIYNFYLSLFNCFNNYFSPSPLSLSNFIFYKYEPYDTSFIDFLNQLSEFGYLWFIDFQNISLPKLSFIDITNLPTPIETITHFSDISITTEYPLYNTVKLIKEPDTNNLPTEIILDKDNPCFTLPFPISPMGISITKIWSEGPYPYVIYFDGLGGIGGEISELHSSLVAQNAIGKTVKDCQDRFTFTIRGVAYCSSCFDVIRIVCERYDNQTDTTVSDCSPDCMSCTDFPLNNCVKEIRIEASGAYGIQQLSKNTKVKINLNWQYICLTPPETPDCLLTGSDFSFNNSLLTHTISIANKYSCNIAPYEIRISNINNFLWNKFIQYQTFKATKKKRIIRLSNPIFNSLKLGYTYNISLPQNLTLTNCLLVEYNISTDDKGGWSLNAVFEQYL